MNCLDPLGGHFLIVFRQSCTQQRLPKSWQGGLQRNRSFGGSINYLGGARGMRANLVKLQSGGAICLDTPDPDRKGIALTLEKYE